MPAKILAVSVTGAPEIRVVRNQNRVVGQWAFVQKIAAKHRAAAVVEVEQVAGRAVNAVHEIAVLDDVLARASLQVMTDPRFMEEAVADIQQSDLPNVNVVALTVAKTVARELRILNGDRRVGAIVSENSVLVIVETGIAQRQRWPLLTNARAVLIGHLSTVELDAVNGGTAATNDPNSLAPLMHAVGIQPGAPANAADRQVTGVPCRHVAAIIAGGDMDRVTVPRGSGSSSNRHVLFAGADGQDRPATVGQANDPGGGADGGGAGAGEGLGTAGDAGLSDPPPHADIVSVKSSAVAPVFESRKD